MKVIYYEPKLKARKEIADNFIKLILKPSECPYGIFDDDEVLSGVCWNVNLNTDDDVQYLIDKISKVYGVKITEEHLWFEFWYFLDYLEKYKKI